ncbi:MAG TPA: helix-turn-helix domain-containing protein [Acidobacteriota bacterium]|nr:helix-turn-helix domain-containing protein [Acidobacteriota bacterium]
MTTPPRLNPVNEFVCGSIRRLRQSRGLGIEEMARRAGIPPGSYSCLETGRYRLNLENLFRILAVLEVEIADVWPQPPEDVPSQLTRASVDEAVSQAERRRPPRARMEDLLTAVCRTCFVTRRELASRQRSARLSRARAIAAFLAWETGHLTLSGLSRRLRRDVSSISHQLRRFRNRLEKDSDSAVILRQTRRTLEELLRRRHLRRLTGNSLRD